MQKTEGRQICSVEKYKKKLIFCTSISQMWTETLTDWVIFGVCTLIHNVPFLLPRWANTTRPGWCSSTSTTPTCAPVASPSGCSPWVHACPSLSPTAAVPSAGDRSVSPPAGEQDQNPQAAGRAGGDAEWVSQPCAQGPLQDQGWAQRSMFGLFFCFVFFPPRPSFITVWIHAEGKLSAFLNRSGWHSWNASATQWKTTL